MPALLQLIALNNASRISPAVRQRTRLLWQGRFDNGGDAQRNFRRRLVIGTIGFFKNRLDGFPRFPRAG